MRDITLAKHKHGHIRRNKNDKDSPRREGSGELLWFIGTIFITHSMHFLHTHTVDSEIQLKY